MKFLGKFLVILLIGCIYTENFNIDSGFGSSSTDVIRNPQNANNPVKFIQSLYKDMLFSLRNQCSEFGYSEIFEMHNEVFSQASICLNKRVDDVEFIKREFSGNFMEIGSLQKFFRKCCMVWPEIYDCINPVLSYTKRCFTSDQKLNLDETLEFMDESNTFFCKNDADRLLKLFNFESMQCIGFVAEDLQKCLINFNRLVQIQQSSNILDPLTPEQGYEACSALQDGRKCISSLKLATCESKDPFNIIDDYIALLQHKGCSSASRLSWFYFVNLLLLVAIYVNSKIF